MPHRDPVQRPDASSRKQEQAPNTESSENDLFPLKVNPTPDAAQPRIDPKSLNGRALLQLQRTIGNQAVIRLVQQSNAVQRDGGGTVSVSRPKPKPKEAVVEVAPEDDPSDGAGPEADDSAPEGEVEAPAEEQEEELDEEQLEAEIEADKEKAAKEDEALEAEIEAIADEEKLSIEEEYEKMMAELEAEGEIDKTPPDPELAELEALADEELEDEPPSMEMIDSEIETIKTGLNASAITSQALASQIKESSKTIEKLYKDYDALMDAIDSVHEMFDAGFIEAADALFAEIESQEEQIEEWELLLLEMKDKVEEDKARLTELLTQREALAPVRSVSYSKRAKAKKAANIALLVTGLLDPVLKPITTAISTVRDAVALVKTLRHIHNLSKIGRNKKMDPKTREALTYLLGKKKTKAVRKGAGVAQMGKAVKAYTGLKSIYKRIKGTKGKNREKFAKVLLSQAKQGDADANAIILELVGTGNIREAMADDGWKVIMDKIKST